MTSHELAQFLLTLPDLPVIMNGWGSDEGVDVEVTGAEVKRRERRNGDTEEIHLQHDDVEW